MTLPKTIFEMVGTRPQPARLSESAVVIMDAQNEHVTGRVPLVGIEASLGMIERLLGAARAVGAPVIHVVHRGKPGGQFDPGGRMFQIHPKAAPGPGERIIEKKTPNAFAKTSLHLALLETKRTFLVLAGFSTHMSIATTARAALDHGWRTTVVADATATRDLPDPLRGEPVPASEVQRIALAELADRFACVALVADLTQAA